jgi:GWxTD domain-containing protein
MFVIFLLFSFPLLATNWQVAIMNRQYLYNNTCLYLTETTGALQGKKVSINMRMRGKGSPFFTFQKNMEWLMGLQPISISYFRFSKGNYTIFVDIYCAETGETTSLELEYDCLPIENGLYASDIFLDYSPIRFLGEKSPILSEKIDESNPNLYFYQEINANKTILTARAILYQEKKSQGNTNATTYTSLRQVNQVLSLQNGTAYFVGNFDLTSLLGGKYLIEILIYADAQLLSEKSTRFEISQEQIFLRPEQIDKSIADLVLLCSSQQIAQLKTLPNALEKKQALLHVFEQHYPMEGIAQAAHYFAKIQSVHQRFANETDFWQSPRVNTFLRYGEPDQIEKMAFQGKEFQKWKYSKWNLLLVFEKKGEKWVLVK